MSKANDVATFHEMAGQPVNTKPTLPDLKAIRFRQHFLLEEAIEGFEALLDTKSKSAGLIIQALKAAQLRVNEIQANEVKLDPVAFFDHLLDIEYVVHGTDHYYGFPMEEGFKEVHEKNMTRFPATTLDVEATLKKAEAEGVAVTVHFKGEHGRAAIIRDDNGKLYKNANFVEPDLASLLRS